MSKLYTIVTVLFLSASLNAQIKKQSILLGGQLSYYSDQNRTDNLHQEAQSGTIGVSVGKAYKDNYIIGINLNYSPLKQTNFLSGNDTVTTKFNGFQIGAFLRQYKMLGKDFYFFGQLDGAFISANQKDDYRTLGDVNATQRGGFISLTPGISYQVFKKMQLELTIPNILSVQYL